MQVHSLMASRVATHGGIVCRVNDITILWQKKECKTAQYCYLFLSDKKYPWQCIIFCIFLRWVLCMTTVLHLQCGLRLQ